MKKEHTSIAIDTKTIQKSGEQKQSNIISYIGKTIATITCQNKPSKEPDSPKEFENKSELTFRKIADCKSDVKC